MPDPEVIRAFLALDPPPEILHRVADIQDALKRHIRGNLGWVRPQGIHLTLKFFGHLAAEGLGDIAAVVAGQAAGTRPLNLEVKGLGVFPGAARPRVLWLGIGGEVERLVVLQKTIDRGLEACGFPREERPFRAHLTLARIRSPQGLSGLDRALAEGQSRSAGAFSATGLTLFQSELTPTGAVYTALNHFPFQG